MGLTHKLDEAACHTFIARCVRRGKNGILSDGGGLYLKARPDGTASWFRRYKVAGARHDIGLGSYEAVTLAEVRAKAQTVNQQLAAGLDPLVERHQARFVGKATRTFRHCAFEVLKEREPSWTNDKHRRDWDFSLKRYVLPLIGDKPVSEIGIKDVLAVLGPHWNTRQVTMTRVRSRIEIILAWAAEHKYRLAGNNPARWRDGLDAFLQIDKPVKRKKPPVATPAQPDPPVLVELHGELAEIKELLKRQRQRVRNEYESGPAILRRLTELERLIRGGDLHIPPKATRRYPTGRDQ